MKVSNIKVYELEESITVSGYPMALNPEDCTIDWLRAEKLGAVKTGTGHDNYLKGIRVAFDIRYSQYWSMQAQRYTFLDIVSSQSKMHRLTKMDISEQCNKYVTCKTIDNLESYIERYNRDPTQENYMYVISNCPMGLELTMRCNTNYQQLKTIYQQRKNHKLEDWGIFCEFIEGLPMFKELTNITES